MIKIERIFTFWIYLETLAENNPEIVYDKMYDIMWYPISKQIGLNEKEKFLIFYSCSPGSKINWTKEEKWLYCKFF